MGFLAFVLIVFVVYALVERHRKEREIGGWFEAMFDYLDGVLR